VLEVHRRAAHQRIATSYRCIVDAENRGNVRHAVPADASGVPRCVEGRVEGEATGS
jgi:hypothetical protein